MKHALLQALIFNANSPDNGAYRTSERHAQQEPTSSRSRGAEPDFILDDVASSVGGGAHGPIEDVAAPVLAPPRGAVPGGLAGRLHHSPQEIARARLLAFVGAPTPLAGVHGPLDGVDGHKGWEGSTRDRASVTRAPRQTRAQ